VRNQFGRFDRYFRLDAGPALVCLDPVLRPGDMEWLADLTPSCSTSCGNRLHERYILRAAPPGGRPRDPSMFDLEFSLEYRSRRLTRIALPPSFGLVITEDLLQRALRPLGVGRVDSVGREVAWSMDKKRRSGQRDLLLRVAGTPHALEETPDRWLLTYRYRLAPRPKGDPEADLTATLGFYRPDGGLHRGVVHWGRVRLTIQDTPEQGYAIRFQRLPEQGERPAGRGRWEEPSP
jgi:hypothetical protein